MVCLNINKKFNKEGKGMRKILSVLLIATLGLFMFTSCNPDSSVTEDLVSVKLVNGSSRSLNADVNFSQDGLYW